MNCYWFHSYLKTRAIRPSQGELLTVFGEPGMCFCPHSRCGYGIFTSDSSPSQTERNVQILRGLEVNCSKYVNYFRIEWGEGYPFMCPKYFCLCGPLPPFYKKQNKTKTIYQQYTLYLLTLLV